MKKHSISVTKGIAGKMIKAFIVFSLAMGLTYLIVFAVQLTGLHNLIKSDEKEQLEFVASQSEETMMSIAEENLRVRIKWATDRVDDEFWIAGHQLKMLQNQVEDICKNPDNYGRKAVYPPNKDNAGKATLQLLSSFGYDNIPAEAMERVERLANLEPMLKEFITRSDFNVDIGVATLDGLALDMDKLSDKKVLDDGSIIAVDVSDQPWYTGAVERGELIFYPIHSLLYDFDEVAFAAPVYVDGELQAVIEGSLKTDYIRETLENSKLGETGFTVLISDQGQLACSSKTSGELMYSEDLERDIREYVNPQLKEAIDKALSGETGVTRVLVDGKDYYAAYGYSRSCKWAQISFISVDEVKHPTNELLADMNILSEKSLADQNIAFKKAALISLGAFVIIVVIAIILVRNTAKKRVRPISKMAEYVSDISRENMSFEMDESYKTGDEIQLLAESFGAFSESIQKYLNGIVSIMSEKQRVTTELALANRIQADMLPSKFPAFPERKEFNIYASMTPAKEVGGDFYDFFFAGDDKLAMVIADVSGKGIPAAMFMMMAKTMIQTQLVANYDVHKVLEVVNNSICSNNREKMFVTVWVGILDLKSGLLTASNAGHEYPIFKEPDGNFEIIKDKHGFVIGGKKNMKYTEYEIQMKAGSKLFVYTDGVPEAMNEDGKLFGMERTVTALNKAMDASAETILKTVEKDVRDYVGSAEQFDDLTMLCIEYFGEQE